MKDKIYVKQALKDLLASFIDMDLDESICGEIRETNAEKIKKCQNIIKEQLLSTQAQPDNQFLKGIEYAIRHFDIKDPEALLKKGRMKDLGLEEQERQLRGGAE